MTCSKLQNEDLPDIELLGAIADAVGVYYNSTGKTKCFNTSQQAVSSLGDKGWYFQVQENEYLIIVLIEKRRKGKGKEKKRKEEKRRY